MPNSKATIATSVVILKIEMIFHQIDYWPLACAGQQDLLNILDLRNESGSCPRCEVVGVQRLQ